MKILRSIWFTEAGSNKPIGVVIVETPQGQKSYIGTGNGQDEGQDALKIATFGAKFPISAAIEL